MRPLRTALRLAATVSAFSVAVQPVAAQSVLRDAETEALFADMSAPLVRAAGLDPDNVRVVLLNDPVINAFVGRRGRLSMSTPDWCWPPTMPIRCRASSPMNWATSRAAM